MKASLLGTRVDGGGAETAGATAFWRVRLEPRVRVGAKAWFEAAYEERVLVASGPPSASRILPTTFRRPFRARQLDWEIAASSGAAWRHEIDRAALVVELRRARLSVGRQAVGWGRGALFGVVDLFAPFNPLEADREWRAGVDALRLDVKTGERSSVDVVAAPGERWDDAAVGGRWRTYWPRADVELVAAKRGEDAMAGVTSSAPVGPLEVHGELAVFRSRDVLPGGVTRHVTSKALVGGSYRVPIGTGVVVIAEYHYSGFGAAHSGELGPLAADPAFVRRFLRGDTQISGRHATAVVASYEASPLLSVSGSWLHSPRDGSGVGAPSLTLTLDDRLSILVTAYASYGRRSVGRIPRSEYGGVATAVLAQLRVYL